MGIEEDSIFNTGDLLYQSYYLIDKPRILNFIFILFCTTKGEGYFLLKNNVILFWHLFIEEEKKDKLNLFFKS